MEVGQEQDKSREFSPQKYGRGRNDTEAASPLTETSFPNNGRIAATLKLEPASPVFAVKCLPAWLRFQIPDDLDVIACTTGRTVLVHTCEEGPPRPRFSEVRRFEDANVDEEYYAISWSALTQKESLMEHLILAVAGKTGVVRILAPLDSARGVIRLLTGHGAQVNELRFHPVDGQLLLSASQDKSIRLWNVFTGCCVCILGGPDGHGSGILSLDVHGLGHTVASGAMDNAVKLWDLGTKKLQMAAARSYGPNGSYRTVCIRAPKFSTQQAHQNYVDCVRFVGDLIVSKCAANMVRVWRPAADRGSSDILVLNEIRLGDTSMWFVRFDVSPSFKQLVVGKDMGLSLVWNLQCEKQRETVASTTAHSPPSCIRMCSWGTQENVFYACTDDGRIRRLHLGRGKNGNTVESR